MSTRIRIPYAAFDLRVLDGDTITAWVAVSADIRQLWRIRLRGIECGELDTEQGQHGFALITQILFDRSGTSTHFIGADTVRDRYGRRIGDIQFGNGELLTLLLMQTGAYWKRNRDGSEPPRS